MRIAGEASRDGDARIAAGLAALARRTMAWTLATAIGTIACEQSATAPIPNEDEAMDYFELISQRRSVRAYQDRPVSDDDLRRILESANRAPSAGNLQAYRIVVVRDAARRQKLARAALGQQFVADAPLVLVFLREPNRSAQKYGRRGGRLYACQDATLAAAYAQLATQALGLGSVWVGAFNDHAVSETVAAPPELEPSSLLVVGYAAEEPPRLPRRPLTDLVQQERIGGKRR